MHVRRHAALAVVAALGSLAACGASDATGPVTGPDQIQLTDAQVRALDSTGGVIKQANPGNATLKALVDSTLLVLTSGVIAQRVAISTDLTTDPLFFVAVHRVYARPAGGSFATWTVIGINDPSHLTSLMEVNGFAQS